MSYLAWDIRGVSGLLKHFKLFTEAVALLKHSPIISAGGPVGCQEAQKRPEDTPELCVRTTGCSSGVRSECCNWGSSRVLLGSVMLQCSSHLCVFESAGVIRLLWRCCSQGFADLGTPYACSNTRRLGWLPASKRWCSPTVLFDTDLCVYKIPLQCWSACGVL